MRVGYGVASCLILRVWIKVNPAIKTVKINELFSTPVENKDSDCLPLTILFFHSSDSILKCACALLLPNEYYFKRMNRPLIFLLFFSVVSFAQQKKPIVASDLMKIVTTNQIQIFSGW